jgi:anthranilate synthase/aminodeoxychorismate synthase-like glutamine amidotransferase
MPANVASQFSIEQLPNIEIVLIDNFDSFTYNLVNQLRPLVKKLTIFRNNTPLGQIVEYINNIELSPVVVISPGPGEPDDAGITLPIIEYCRGKFPLLGICLGHQAIIQSYQGTIGAAKEIIHGRASDVVLKEDCESLFDGLCSPFRAARYHSLAATYVSDQLKVIAVCEDEVMGVSHRNDRVLGFQFHPESILTPKGSHLMKNALVWLSHESSLQQNTI